MQLLAKVHPVYSNYNMDDKVEDHDDAGSVIINDKIIKMIKITIIIIIIMIKLK